MSQDLLAPLWARLDAEPPVFFADRSDPALAAGRERLIELGFLHEIEPARFALCSECGGGHVRLVRWAENPKDGTRTAYVPCPNCGRVRIDPNVLIRWAVDVPCLLSAVFAAAGGRAALSELVPGRLWFLGGATWGGRSRQAYFARFVHGHERASALAALNPYRRAVLFHPTERAARQWADTTPNPVVALESVVALGPDGLTFDGSIVAGRLADAGFGAPKPKPPQRRGERAGKIERLVKELREWLPKARNHAHATRDLNGTPQLLKQLTQQDLATMAEMPEYDVSRCLNDPDAVLLKLLWETAADLDKILAWDGRVGGDPP